MCDPSPVVFPLDRIAVFGHGTALGIDAGGAAVDRYFTFRTGDLGDRGLGGDVVGDLGQFHHDRRFDLQRACSLWSDHDPDRRRQPVGGLESSDRGGTCGSSTNRRFDTVEVPGDPERACNRSFWECTRPGHSAAGCIGKECQHGALDVRDRGGVVFAFWLDPFVPRACGSLEFWGTIKGFGFAHQPDRDELLEPTAPDSVDRRNV